LPNVPFGVFFRPELGVFFREVAGVRGNVVTGGSEWVNTA
jgi:hypothetical protein